VKLEEEHEHLRLQLLGSKFKKLQEAFGVLRQRALNASTSQEAVTGTEVTTTEVDEHPQRLLQLVLLFVKIVRMQVALLLKPSALHLVSEAVKSQGKPFGTVDGLLVTFVEVGHVQVLSQEGVLRIANTQLGPFAAQ
jgi:hypothetical protein